VSCLYPELPGRQTEALAEHPAKMRRGSKAMLERDRSNTTGVDGVLLKRPRAFLETAANDEALYRFVTLLEQHVQVTYRHAAGIRDHAG